MGKIHISNNFFLSNFSCGPNPLNEMISRRKILSRSRDQLNFGEQFDPYEDEEDVWYNKDKLFKVSKKIY